MPGFFCAVSLSTNQTFATTGLEGSQTISLNEQELQAFLMMDTHDKFGQDKIFQQDDDYLVILDGVVFNKLELISEQGKDWKGSIISLYERYGDSFCSKLRGSFSGALLDKRTGRWIFYNDHIGDKQLFYFKNENLFVLASEIKYILHFLRLNKISYTLDDEGAYMLLSFGFQLEDFTLLKEVKRLKPGHLAVVDHGKLSFQQYYILKNETDRSISNEKDLIENIDYKFRSGVKRQFDKDIEYGYRHLVALSGGLDSRMTTWVAHEMGYADMLNFTFSQSDYWDEKTAKAIADHLKHEWIFKSLDNGLFLKSQLEPVTAISYGGALYYGLAHGKSCMDLINMSSFGMVHSGQLGDAILGSFFKNASEIRSHDNYKKGAYSTFLIDRIESLLKEIGTRYPDNELFRFYTRAFNGANQGLVIAQQSSETYSPFYDIEFLEFCLSVPQEYRMNHRIYIKWIQEKYPEAATFHWEKIGTHLNAQTINIKGRPIPLSQVMQKGMTKLLTKARIKVLDRSATKHHMNPLDYWYNTNENLKQWLDQYFFDHLAVLDKNPDLKNDAERMYKEGNNTEKNQVITLLAACKILF